MLPPVIAPGGLGRRRRSTRCSRTSRSGARSQGTKLSGGEQQMLAIARILRTGAQAAAARRADRGPRAGDRPADRPHDPRARSSAASRILLVEQNFRFAATVADRHYVMEHGRVIDMIPNAELEASMGKLHEYLGV